MKKLLSTITVILLVIGLLSSSSISSFASNSNSRGKGLIDGEQYYIYGYYNGYTYFVHSEYGSVANMADVCITQHNIFVDQSPWNDSRYMWMLEKQSDGTYLIEILNEKYLKVKNDGSIIIHHYIGGDEYKFDICRVDEGPWQGSYTIKNGNKYLSRNYEFGTSWALLDTPTECSYWTFMAAEKGAAEYYGYENGDFNTATPEYRLNGKTIAEYFYSMDYYESVYTWPIRSDIILEYLPEFDISIFTGQGAAGHIITDPNATYDSMIMADYELTSGYGQQYIGDFFSNDLARSRCIIYASSYSGNSAIGNDGDMYNLVDVTYNRGAHFVLGFKCNMPGNLINQWMLRFWAHINDNCSIRTSIILACYATGLYDNELSGDEQFDRYIYYRGDWNQYLHF